MSIGKSVNVLVDKNGVSGITPYPEIPALTLSDGFTATWNLPHVPFCGCNIGDKETMI